MKLTDSRFFDIIRLVNQLLKELNMNLLNFFKKTKSASTNPTPMLGTMWVCVVKRPDSANFDVMVKEVCIVDAGVRVDGIFVLSNERNPFSKCDPIDLRGYVDRMEMYDRQSYWVGFFETKEKAENGYCELAKKWIDNITSKMPN